MHVTETVAIMQTAITIVIMADMEVATAATMVVAIQVPNTKAKWTREHTCVPLVHRLVMVNA